MSGLAKFSISKGVKVSGSDLQKSAITQELEEQGASIFIGCSKKNINGQDLVVFTDAISPKNKELLEAQKKQIKTISRADFLAEVAGCFKKQVAVSGCHGKTTTTGMLAFALQEFKPTAHIGGLVNGENFVVGKNKLFITEACEYKKNLLKLKPDVAVVLNLGLDHTDCYKNLADVKKTFSNFVSNIKKDGFLVVNGDDKNCNNLEFENRITFGLSEKNDVYAKHIKQTNSQLEFDLFAFGKYVEKIRLNCTLKHNVLNALATIAVCLALGAKDFAQNLQKFNGVKRRNEFIKEIDGAKIYHDYAHHPKEISKIISQHKKQCLGKLYVIFEAHTYSRTKALIGQFEKCFKQADETCILPIYPAREKKIRGINGKFLARRVGGKFVKNYAVCKKLTLSKINSGDEVLILGAGSVNKLADMF